MEAKEVAEALNDLMKHESVTEQAIDVLGNCKSGGSLSAFHDGLMHCFTLLHTDGSEFTVSVVKTRSERTT